MGGGKQLGHVAEEIMEEILSRLPVKSLLRFQLVSKAWASLIGSEGFIKTHLQNSRENADLANHRVIYDYAVFWSLRKWKINKLKQYSVHSLMNDPVADPSGLEHLTDFRIVGCCNGLVCILNPSQNSFSLWNPSTRVLIELSKLKTEERTIYRTGFGWDESSGAYKVFVFLFLYARKTCSCIVYSSNTKKWEKVETDFEWGIFHAKEDGLLVNGKLHWHGYGGSGMVAVIASLDLKSVDCAMIGTMGHPCAINRDLLKHHMNRDWLRYRVSLGVLGGCLSVAHHRVKVGEELDVWVMKEYGVKESWYRAMSVRLDHLRVPHCTPANVLGEGPDGEILISYGSFFLAYHPEKNAVVSELKEIKDGATASAHLYYESLVSPERILGRYVKPKRNTQKPIKLKDYILTQVKQHL